MSNPTHVPQTPRESLANSLAGYLSPPDSPLDPHSASTTTLPPSLSIPTVHLEQLLTTILSHHTHNKQKDDNPLHQARLGYFVSQGTTLKFDGDQEKLIPWIKRFRSLRTNAVWQSATYVTDDTHTYDLLTQFTRVTESVIKVQATNRWTAINQKKSMLQDHPDLYYPRILGKVIINSTINEFYTILQNYAGTELSNDGPYLLWLILSHFHTGVASVNDLSPQILIRTSKDTFCGSATNWTYSPRISLPPKPTMST